MKDRGYAEKRDTGFLWLHVVAEVCAVVAEYRRKQIGTLLLKKDIDYLLNSGVETIRLEAVPSIAGLYRELGFIDEYDSLRFTGYSNKMVSLNI
jgi:GNAT superfamily N-acetyltransferase